MDAFLAASPSSNAKEIRNANAQHMEYISVDDPFVTLNVNTPEEYARLAKLAGVEEGEAL
jgi:hypothetical protein